jgi:hypothetical protein
LEIILNPAVTNIIYEWKQRLGSPTAEELRELAIALKKVGISTVQCATGFRVAMMMNRLGIREDKFESFMSDTYSECDRLGVGPKRVVSFLEDLLRFSETVSLSKLDEYIESKAQEERVLNQEIEKLKEQKGDLEAQKSVAERQRDMALEDENMTYDNLKWYTSFREELRRLQIPVDDISHLVKIVNGTKQYGYDVEKIVEVFSDSQFLPVELKITKAEVAGLNQELNDLRKEASSLQQTISTYGQLSILGIGIKELRLLHDNITRIAVSNGIPPDQATARFFEDIEKNYDKNLNFESKFNNHQADVHKLKQRESELRSQIMTLQCVGPSLDALFQKGVTEQDIVDIAGLLDSGTSNTGSFGSDTPNRDVTIKGIRSLITELREYGSKKNTLGKISQDVDNLKNQLASLTAEKKDLEADNQGMLLYLSYLRDAAIHLSGFLVSVKYEFTWLASMMGYMIGVEQQKKLQNSDLGGFELLLQRVKGEDMSLPELETLIAKLAEILLGKLESNNNDDSHESNIAKIKQSLSEVLVELTK